MEGSFCTKPLLWSGLVTLPLYVLFLWKDIPLKELWHTSWGLFTLLFLAGDRVSHRQGEKEPVGGKGGCQGLMLGLKAGGEGVGAPN